MLKKKNRKRIQVNNAQSKGIYNKETEFITTDAKNLPSHTYKYTCT